jgi:hypothetical protein
MFQPWNDLEPLLSQLKHLVSFVLAGSPAVRSGIILTALPALESLGVMLPRW